MEGSSTRSALMAEMYRVMMSHVFTPTAGMGELCPRRAQATQGRAGSHPGQVTCRSHLTPRRPA